MPTEGFGPRAQRRVTFGESAFRAAAMARFPELTTQLEAQAGLIHPAMGVLGEAARDAIKEGDAERFDRIVKFLDEMLAIPNLDPEIENAVQISFLGAAEIQATESGQAAWHRLPVSVRGLLTDYQRRFREAFPGAKGKGK